MTSLTADFPEKLDFLFDKYRYKVAYGGRGSGKSWGFARALILLSIKSPMRVLCAREVQKSIKQSVHQLLADQIRALGVAHLFEILETEIRGQNGTLFTFTGLANHTVDSVKSFEGADVCWVEEAQTVSQRSWNILIPTIRKPGSEIWVSFNPDLESDDTYQRFVVSKPPNSMVVRMNFDDNPWFPDELRDEMEHLKGRDYEAYKNVWLGECKYLVEGAVYKAEMERVRNDGRIRAVAYDPVVCVDTYWDLGVADSTSIWFVQQVGNEVRVIDYYEASNEGLPHYAQVLNTKGYVYGKHWAPHDIMVRELGSGRSRYETAKSLGIEFERVPNIKLEDGIHAVRMLLPRCYFDTEKSARGVECLCNYRREIHDKTGEVKKTPVHDWASHGADAFRYLAVALEEVKEQKPKKLSKPLPRGARAWMG